MYGHSPKAQCGHKLWNLSVNLRSGFLCFRLVFRPLSFFPSRLFFLLVLPAASFFSFFLSPCASNRFFFFIVFPRFPPGLVWPRRVATPRGEGWVGLGLPSRRVLGFRSQQVVAGNPRRSPNQRPPALFFFGCKVFCFVF